MRNNIFRFKKFSVEQSDNAMKVGTDGVLIGAWADTSKKGVFLDVGTGTGLIAMMLAQRGADKIYAIDINDSSVDIAKKNIENSQWNDIISVDNVKFQDFNIDKGVEIDHIVSNPPFFINSLKSGNNKKDMARHTDTLSFKDFFESASVVLSKNGAVSVILPDVEAQIFIKTGLEYNFFVRRVTDVKPTPEKPVKRVMIEFCRTEISDVKRNSIVVEDRGRHCYSEEYKELTRDFYLAF
ncbi:MAG: methyltransferase [Bacteroidales bacterium]|jgi:tRNA1Val (adenine37-N6)-methyltransferase|nr:methyltransferase [Bacteroidales bacterium]